MAFDKKRHRCQLPDADEELRSDLPPNASCWARCLDRFTRYTYLSHDNPKCDEFFKSRAAFTKEYHRHMTNRKYKWVIHPFSRFAKHHTVILYLLWVLVFSFDPIHSTFVMIDYVIRGRISLWLRIVHVVLDVSIAVDIVINFFMGYVVKQTHEIVLDRRKVAFNYLTTYFFFDFAAFMNCVLPLCLPFLSKSTVMFVHLLVAFRLARFCMMRRSFLFVLKLMKLSDSAIQILDLIVFTMGLLHWWTCCLSLVPLLTHVFGWSKALSWTILANERVTDDNDLVTRYMDHLLITMCHFYGAGHGEFRSMNPQEMYVFSLIILSGISYYTYAIALVCQVFGTVNISGTKYDEFIYQVNEYCITKKLPQQLKRRLFLYYEYKFQRKFFYERAIFDSLSEHLRLEIVLYSCKHLIRCVHVFRTLSRPAIGTILGQLKQEVFLPGDRITGLDVHTDLCYFISYGTMSCYVAGDDTEVIHLEDGDYFERDVRNDGDVVMIKAIETCDVYTIPKSLMAACKTNYPEISLQIGKFKALMEDCMARSLAQRRNKSQRNILRELAYDRIINKGKKR